MIFGLSLDRDGFPETAVPATCKCAGIKPYLTYEFII